MYSVKSWLKKIGLRRAGQRLSASAKPASGKRNRWIQIFSLLAVLAYGLVVEKVYGWHTLLSAWASIPAWQPVLALVLMFFTYLVRGLRIHYYFLPSTQGHLPLCLKIMLIHNLLNNLLPMRTGEASFPLLMRNYFKIPLSSAAAGLLLLRLLDLQVLLSICWFTLIVYKMDAPWMWISVPLLALSPLLLLVCQPLLIYGQNRVSHPKIKSLIGSVLIALPRDFAHLFNLWVYTWLCWATKFVVFTLAMLWFAHVHWTEALAATLGGELSGMLPIHPPGGLGTYEASMVGAARLFGVQGDWVLFAAVQLHLLILLSTLLGGLVAQFLGKTPPALASNDSPVVD